jgi:prophage DNA circulation protein
MATIKDWSGSPWRDRLAPASFRGCGFLVETTHKASGRRIVLHEYPKRDVPYAEDMGRRARRFRLNAYLIGPNYLQPRDNLINALEAEGPGILICPTLPRMKCACEGYSLEETREKGGYCTFDMQFVEEGVPGFGVIFQAPAEQIEPKIEDQQKQDGEQLDKELSA